MLYLSIFGLEFEKAIVIFETKPLEFVYLQSFVKKKMPKFGTKNVLLGYFWARILIMITIVIFESSSRICLIAKFYEKTQMPKFEPKNALFGYF